MKKIALIFVLAAIVSLGHVSAYTCTDVKGIEKVKGDGDGKKKKKNSGKKDCSSSEANKKSCCPSQQGQKNCGSKTEEQPK
ncbi:MAG: hypothetical protein NZ529_03890 [Cytophagaceae bacterium]|nr:hypothetical protein [Cytophagaceae bacterium]MDW8455913.1 hypothetical protein [Cytophagaceae bacterium]